MNIGLWSSSPNWHMKPTLGQGKHVECNGEGDPSLRLNCGSARDDPTFRFDSRRVENEMTDLPGRCNRVDNWANRLGEV